MIRRLFLTLESITESTAKVLAAQKRSLDSVARVVLDYRIVLDYVLAEAGGVCTAANATNRIDISREGEAQSLSEPLG